MPSETKICRRRIEKLSIVLNKIIFLHNIYKLKTNFGSIPRVAQPGGALGCETLQKVWLEIAF